MSAPSSGCRHIILPVAALAAFWSGVARADAPPRPLWLMQAGDWRGASIEQRMALVADYMRVFCSARPMPSPQFASCLDKALRPDEGADSAMFDHLAACQRALSR